MAESPAKTSSANLSDLVKEMVKEMDANDFYSRGDMYDESAEEPWFTIDICLKRGDGEPASPGASLRKPWSEFQRLHYLLVTDEFGCDDAVKTQLPNLPPGPVPLVSGERSSSGGGGGCGGVTDSGSSADIAQGLDAYLKALLDVPAVVQSQVFSGFLEKNSGRRPEKEEEEKQGAGARSAPELGSSDRGGDGSGYGGEGAPRSPETAIDFLLQPFDYGRAYVPRRAEHTERIDVLRGESVVWKFEVMDHLDIEFSVVFRPHPIAVPSWVPGDDINGQATDPGGVVSSPGPRGFGRGGAVMAKESNGCGKGASAASGSGQRQRSGWWRSGSGGAGGSGDGGGVGSENKAAGKVEEAEEGDGTVNDQTVHLPTRYSTGGGDPVQGSFTCSADGMCILRWDNCYSRLRGKRLCFVVESATVQTMRAAIEAAGAADHKRRATRSVAAQTILDSGAGEAKVSVTAVGGIDDLYRGSGDQGEEGDGSGNGNAGGGGAPGGDASMSYYGSHYRFGRVRRVAASLLRDLGTIVDARESGYGAGTDAIGTSDGCGGGGQGWPDGGAATSIGGVLRSSGCGNVEVEGVETLVARFEVLEDEVASASARRAQSEAQAKVLLATLQKANTKADRLERNLEETQEKLSETRLTLEETEATRDEAAAAGAAASARLQTSEEQLLRAKRERDLLQAERSVWQVARSGIQEELAKVVAELELERHRHEDTSRALAKSHESRAHAEAEAARLSHRLEEERGGAGGVRAALATEREASRLAREEAEDARAAVAELDAAVAELGAQKRVLVAGLRARERALGDRCASAEARAEEAAMMRRAAESRARELEEDAERREAAQADGEIRLQRLRAEKKVLLAEIRRGTGGAGTAAGSVVGGTGKGAEVDEDMAGDNGSDGGRGREGNGSRRGLLSPRASGDSVQDNKASLKQLSRQLVHLRERQHHLREDLRADPSNASAQRHEADVNRAVQNLEMRIRRLLSIVTGGDDDASSSAGSPPVATAATRKVHAASSKTQEVVEVETYSV